MSKRVFASATMRDGKIQIAHRTRFDDMVARAFADGERVMLTVEKSTRNLRQNALYWHWVGIVSNALGWDPDYTHHENKRRFNLRTVMRADPSTGEMMEEQFPGPTHNMSVDLFAEFMERVQRGWAEEGIDLPSANDEEYS